MVTPRALCFVAFALLCTSCLARPSNLWLPWFFPEPEPEPSKHPHPKLEIEEIPVPDSPKSTSWFSALNKEFHSAVLIAGSNGYHNYRHQSDVCHAYRLLRERGLKDENIITFVFDDIAYNEDNPYPGKIFNTPGGSDVYRGCAKDYVGKDVNRKNVMAALTGNAEAVRGKGSGRVLKPDPKQRILLVYSDHGSVGSVGMPSGESLTAKDFHNTFNYMVENNFFSEMVFYLESCESGSIFQGFDYELQNKILPISASGPYESSYATYCPYSGGTTGSPNASYIGSCMGDLFTVSWMEYAESHDVAQKKVADQLKYVKRRTSDDYQYSVGSHVYVYAPEEIPIKDQVVGNFLSYFDVPAGLTREDGFSFVPSVQENLDAGAEGREAGWTSLKQQDADLMYFVHRTMRNDIEDKDKAMRELQAVLESRRTADRQVRTIVKTLTEEGLLGIEDGQVDDYVNHLKPRPQNAQVVDDWDCFEGFIAVWSQMCGTMNDYSRQFTRVFANLCNDGINVAEFSRASIRACAANGNTYSSAV